MVHGDGKPEGGRKAMAQLLALEERPTAVFCYNDMTALGALKEIRLAGLCVPEDISLIGFDDLYISQYTEPPLTTVRQPVKEMGRPGDGNSGAVVVGRGIVARHKSPSRIGAARFGGAAETPQLKSNLPVI
jgi:hypothetical protein